LGHCATQDDCVALLVPVLMALCDVSLEMPLYASSRDRLLFGIYHAPFFLETLADYLNPEALASEVNTVIVKFVTRLALSLLEARANESVKKIAILFRGSQVEGANKLCSILMIDSPFSGGSRAANLMTGAQPEGLRHVCWGASDHRPPGGRHDNDHINFRDITIVPTSEEVVCSARPYLPLASGANRFAEITDDTSYLLDSQFRLLREDCLRDLREGSRSGRTLTGVHAVSLFLAFKTFGRPCVVFRFDRPEHLMSKKDAVDFWDRFRGLKPDTLMGFTRHGRTVRYGTVVMCENDSKWLNNAHGPLVGIEFDRATDLAEVLREMGDFTTEKYELVVASQSFFSYKPILACLQAMTEVPMTEELVHGISTGIRPPYLPRHMTLPSDFGGIGVDLNDWPFETILEQTTLDHSQSMALHRALTTKVALIQGPPGKSFSAHA
jgi:hypothetical protein